jgi:hypothetical protein
MFPIKYNGDILSHNARVGVDGGIVESLDFVNDFSEQTKRVNIPSSLPLLDVFDGAAAAYSLRKLRTAYTGSAIQVRRSSDNATQNIGFDSSGNLDTAALSSFVGAASGTVSIWYDQSGNNRNVTQSTAASQPLIFDSGSIRQINNIKVIQPDGVNDFLTTASRVMINDFAIFMVAFGRETGGGATLTQYTSGGGGAGRLICNAGDPANTYSSAIQIGGTSTTLAGSSLQRMRLTYYNRSGSSVTLGVDGGALGSMTTSTVIDNVPMTFFTIPGIGSWSTVSVAETIIYNNSQSTNRTAIESNINSYYQIY